MLIFTNLSSDTEEFTQDIQTCSTTQVDVLVTYRVGVQLLWVCCLECLYNHRCTDWLYSCNIDNVECDGALATVEWTYICNLWVCTCGCVHVGVYMWVCVYTVLSPQQYNLYSLPSASSSSSSLFHLLLQAVATLAQTALPWLPPMNTDALSLAL